MNGFLGLSLSEWTELGIAILIIIAGFAVLGWLVKSVLLWLSHRTATELDDQLVEATGGQIKWLAGIITAQVAISTLDFLPQYIRERSVEVFFIFYLAILTIAAWRIIDVVINWYRDKARTPKETETMMRMMPAMKRVAHLLLLILSISILLSYFKIDITAFIAALGIGSLAISLAAQDVLADLISGILIYFDQPFRIGDRIDIVDKDTTVGGQVVDIGIRTTRIRTPDNRVLIVPNSNIAKGKVVNFTYPETRYQIYTEIGVGYGSDIDMVRNTIIETVSHVDGIFSDEPVSVNLVGFRNSTMVFRTFWWINSYLDAGPTTDRVNASIIDALDKAGIEVPIMTYDINFRISPETTSRIAQALR